jgi:membrane protein YqaA with SNARE-associated domain
VGFLETLADFVKPAIRQQPGLAAVLRHLGAFGLLLLAIADSSPIPTLAGPDILTAILAARQREPWYYYASVATVGSVIGAYMTFRIARKAGLDYLTRKFGERKVARLLNYFERWGTGALVFSTAVPFPFPTSAFFAAAGVLDYPLRRFLIVVALGRAVRYGAIAAIASYYGRRFVVGLQHPGQHFGWLLASAATVVIAIVGALLLKRRLE